MDRPVALRVNAERLVVLAWPRAILMQMAHPLIAAGVAAHSSFRSGTLAAPRRLHGTVGAMLALSFGDARARDGALAGIRAIHRRVHGTLPEPVGRFPAGTRYSAEDPDLVRWVHLTLLDSILPFYERIVGPLTPAERDAYCRESAWVAVALGAVDEDVPRTWAELRRAVDAMLASDTLAVGRDGRAIASAVLSPPLAGLAWPVSRFLRRLTVESLPPAIASLYGLQQTPGSADRAFARLRRLRRTLPGVVAEWRGARRAAAALIAETRRTA
jgi:uncharacterized protein (DUF2236 family)